MNAKPWTAERVRGLGVRTDLVTAAEVCGIGRTGAYDLARRGELPFPVRRLGTRYVVPVAGLLEFLNLPAEGTQ